MIIELDDKLESVEIFYLHYKNEQEVIDRWKRRIKRVNFDKLLIKFNDQNGCTNKEILEFNKLCFRNKICFTNHKEYCNEDIFYIRTPKKDHMMGSYEPMGNSRIVNIT